MSERCGKFAPLLSAWADDELTGKERGRVAAHLRACRICREEVEGLARLRVLLRSLPVRRVPAGLLTAPGSAAGEPAPGDRRAAGERHGHRVAGRAAATFAVLAGLVGGAAFSLGGPPDAPAPAVPVPMDLYAVDHLVRTAGGPVSTPVLVGAPGGPAGER